jgi:lipopolysaccharide transport system ATP-binding protein
MKPIIKIENLSKQYRLGPSSDPYATLRETFHKIARSPLKFLPGRQPDETEWFWALRDISFEVEPGEVVGIIGRNGAGKSTLLKILSRITEPTKGKVELYGRVGSLLEVGTGFHPELTGRENVYLNGAILGMKRSEVAKKFDEIVEFAEIEKFLDTPVKKYSSGMYVRLAFAVAAHLEPEILIVDEVLAVGDFAFQKKCLGKMNKSASEGRTILFVSHSIAAVRKFCNRAILLNDGNIKKIGDVDSVLKTYIETGISSQQVYELPLPKEKNLLGFAHKLTIEDENGNSVSSIPVGKPWQVRINFTITKGLEHLIIGLGLLTSEEVPLKTSWSKPYTVKPGEYQAVFREEIVILGTGCYGLVVGLSENEKTFYFVENAGTLEIAEFSEGVDLLRISSVGSILNPMNVELFQDKNLITTYRI